MPNYSFKGKYELEKTPLKICEKPLELFTVKSIKGFNASPDSIDNEYINDFPFWIKIWEAAIILSDFFGRTSHDKEAEVLEIGAGMGIVGLFMGSFGYKNVTITDFEDDALDLLRKNAAHNNIDDLQIEKLDWNALKTDKKYDIICGSELIYSDKFIDPVIDLIHNLLKPGGKVIIAHDFIRKSLVSFIEKLQPGFDVKSMAKSINTGDEVRKIVIHKLEKK